MDSFMHDGLPDGCMIDGQSNREMNEDEGSWRNCWTNGCRCDGKVKKNEQIMNLYIC